MPAPLSARAFAERERPGALLLGLVAWVVAVVALSTLLAPAFLAAAEALFGDRFPPLRVFRRLALLVAVGAIWFWARALGVRRWAQVGLTAEGWRSRAGWQGLALGAGAALLLFAVELGAGWRVVMRWPGPGDVALALVAAPLIGLLEESVCRGFLLYPFGRLAGTRFWLGASTVSALYASAHFARGGRGLELDLDRWVGWQIWSLLPQVIAEHWRAWIGLFAVGLFFYWLAARDGHVWRVAGLHAGAVLTLRLGGIATDARSPEGETLFFTAGLQPDLPLAIALLLMIALLAQAGGARRVAEGARSRGDSAD